MTKMTTDAAAAEAANRVAAERTAAERRIAELEYEKLVRDCAVRGGVLPQAVDWCPRRARAVRHTGQRPEGAHRGGDPLSPLTFEAWLAERKKDVPFLFVKEG
jgi:hypothetical protein